MIYNCDSEALYRWHVRYDKVDWMLWWFVCRTFDTLYENEK